MIRYGVEFNGMILVYHTEFDATRTLQKINDGIVDFGWSNDEILPPLMVKSKDKFNGVLMNG